MRSSNIIYAFPQNHKAPGRARSRRSIEADRCVAVCCGLFLAGVLLGAFSVSFFDSTAADYAAYLTKTGLVERAANTSLRMFISAAALKLLALMVLRMLSGSLYGAPVICLVLLVFGASCGIRSGCAYHILGVKAFGFNALILAPPTLIFAFSCALYAASALRTSLMLYDLSVQGNASARFAEAFSKDRRRLYTAAAAMFASALAEHILLRAFGEWFF